MGRKNRFRAVFSFLRQGNHVRTYVYVDGYNLFYSCLKNTPYKWLDLYTLFSDAIVKPQSPATTVARIKYFTADIKTRFATHGAEAQAAQDSYHRALLQLYPSVIEIIKGYYHDEPRPLIRYSRPPDKTNRVKVWTLEEKQTDVNIALHLYRDVVVQKVCDQVVVVSNDTDLEPVLHMLRLDMGKAVNIGIVLPRPELKMGTGRPSNVRLSRYADWTRHHIRDAELAGSQLPTTIPTGKKPIRKPSYW